MKKNRIKAVTCDNCLNYTPDIVYRGEGLCGLDNEYTRDHRVCNKLPTDMHRREVKLSLLIKNNK